MVTGSQDLWVSCCSSISIGRLRHPPTTMLFLFPSFKNYFTVIVKKLNNTVVQRQTWKKVFFPLSCLILFQGQFAEPLSSSLFMDLHTNMCLSRQDFWIPKWNHTMWLDFSHGSILGDHSIPILTDFPLFASSILFYITAVPYSFSHAL